LLFLGGEKGVFGGDFWVPTHGFTGFELILPAVFVRALFFEVFLRFFAFELS